MYSSENNSSSIYSYENTILENNSSPIKEDEFLNKQGYFFNEPWHLYKTHMTFGGLLLSEAPRRLLLITGVELTQELNQGHISGGEQVVQLLSFWPQECKRGGPFHHKVWDHS